MWQVKSQTRCLSPRVSLAGEAIQSAYYLLNDTALNQRLGAELDNTVRRMMRIQRETGLWGEGTDRRGCSGVATLLAWHFLSFKGDETIPQALDKFWQNLSNPVHAQSFGVLAHPSLDRLGRSHHCRNDQAWNYVQENLKADAPEGASKYGVVTPALDNAMAICSSGVAQRAGRSSCTHQPSCCFL